METTIEPHLDGQKVVKALQYLQREGFSGERLRNLHHTQRDCDFEICIDWRIKNPGPDYRQGNPDFHKRLLYVAAEHWRTGRHWDDLASEALRQFPK